jgi:hypothetical protein
MKQKLVSLVFFPLFLFCVVKFLVREGTGKQFCVLCQKQEWLLSHNACT